MKPVDLSPESYHAIGFNPAYLPDIAQAGPVSASTLSRVRNPLTFLLNYQKPTSRAMNWGSIVDCLWLTPDLFDVFYAIMPEDLKKPTSSQLGAANPAPATVRQIARWNEFTALAEGKEIITAEIKKEATKAVNMLNQHKLAMEIHAASAKQVALLGPSPIVEDGSVQAKMLIDLLPLTGRFSDAVADLKTTRDIDDHPITGIMHAFEYHMKMGYYGMGATAAGFGPRHRGIIIWQRSTYPYDVCVREIAPADMALGRQMAVDRMNLLMSLDASRLDDHYDEELRVVELKAWQRGGFIPGDDEGNPITDLPD